MRQNVRSRKLPVIKQFGQQLVLHAKGYVGNVALIGLAVAEKIEVEDAPVRSETRHDASPHVGRKRRSMDEDERRPRTAHAIPNCMPLELVGAG
jgi:hypothetical protein